MRTFIKNIILSEVPGTYYYNCGDAEKAKEITLKLFKEGERSPNNLLLLGRIYFHENKLEDAHDYLIKSLIRYSPVEPTLIQQQSAYQYLFQIEKKRRNLSRAVEYAEKSLSFQDSINKRV